MAMLGLFNDPTGDATATPGSVDYRRRMAGLLAQQATDASPKGHWAHILAQALQGGVSGYEESRATADERAGRKSVADAFAGGATPSVGAVASNPWMPSSVLPHVLGAGDRAADRSLREREVKLHEAAGGRASEMQQWQIAQLIESMKKPSDTTAVLDAMGVPVAPRPAPLMPPLPSWAAGGTPGATPPRVALPPAGSLRAPGASPAPSFPRGYALPTDVPGTTVTGPTAAATPPPALSFPPGYGLSPAPAPTAPAPASPWASNPTAGATVGLMATGRLPPEAARMILAGPAWAGVPESTRNEAYKEVHKANEAAATHGATVASIEQLKALAPAAFVGAGAEARASAAGMLASLGVNHQWLIANQNLPATQLLQQGLSQFIGTEAAKYKPISNSDITFIARTVPNAGQDRTSLMNALEAAHKVALRQQLYETGKAELLARTPYPNLAMLRERIKKEVPDHVFDPKLGREAAAAPGATSGGSSGGTALPPGAYSWSPDGGVTASPAAPTAPRRMPTEPASPAWSRYR